MRIEVIRQHGDLAREVWTFYFIATFSGTTLWLDHWTFENRPTTRHRKWQRQMHWDRTDGRSNTVEKVTAPQDVVEQAKEKVIAQIKPLQVMQRS